MISPSRRELYTAKFKAKVAVEAIKEDRTIAELSSKHSIHRNMIPKWKSEALTDLVYTFSSNSGKDRKSDQELTSKLYRQTCQLTVEKDWLKKQLSSSTEDKRNKIDWNHPCLSVSMQCSPLSISKGAVYYKLVPMDFYNLELMDKIDEQYLKTPFYGSRRMTVCLRNAGSQVNRKRIQRLMQLMGLEAIYPKANLSKRRHDHRNISLSSQRADN